MRSATTFRNVASLIADIDFTFKEVRVFLKGCV